MADRAERSEMWRTPDADTKKYVYCTLTEYRQLYCCDPPGGPVVSDSQATATKAKAPLTRSTLFWRWMGVQLGILVIVWLAWMWTH